MKNIPIILVFCLFLAVSADAQRTGGFRRLQIDDNAGSMSWIISNQSSLGIDETGATTGTFPNTNAMLTLGAGTKGNALDLQSMLGGTGILFSQNQPLTGIDMSIGASGTGLIIDGATPLGISIGLISAGSDGMTIDATNSGISIGNGTAPSNGMNIEATSTGLAIGTATLPDVGQTTEANLIGGTFDAGIIGVDIGQVNSPLLGLGVQAFTTGVDVQMPFSSGTGININGPNFAGPSLQTSNSFGTGIDVINSFGTGLNISSSFGTGLNINSAFGSGAVINGGTDNVLVVNGTADATLLNVGADPVWDARVNGDLHVSGLIKMGGSIYVDGFTPNNHSILANDDLTIGTNAAGQNFNLVAGPGGMINITAPIMFPPLPSLSDLDMGNFRILNIGNAGTDFTAAGGLVLADNLTIGNIPALSLSTDVLVTNAGVVQQRTAASLISGSAWALNGNALTGVLPAAPVERFGSTNGADVIMMTAGAEQMRLRSSGGINIPTTTAAGVGAIYQNGILFTHSFGFQSYFAGAGAGNLGVTGAQNTGVGFFALNAVSTGQQNTALGNSALRNNQSGNYNTAVGLNALQLNVSGVNNTAVGLGALLNNTASNNTAVGFEALTANMGGTQNTAMGVVALQKNTSGSSNTANGFAALQNNVTGSNNTALGYGTLANGGSMNNSTAVGTAALISTSGDDNTAVGYASLQTTSTGTGNTGIGKFAGTANLTGSNNTFAGNNANPSANNLTNATAIGANAVVNASNTIQLGSGSVTRISTSGSLSARGVDYVWPAADGAGVLMSNGALALSWNNNPTLGGLHVTGNIDVGGSISNGAFGGSGLNLNDHVLLQGLTHFNGNANFNNQGQLNFKELSVNGLNQISFRAPAAVTADVLFTLPSDGGTAGQVLSTSGGATPTLSWIPAGSGWSLTGNNLTGGTPATPNEWLGSSNNYDVIFRSANTERMRISSTGNVGIGSTSPFTQLTMPGSVPSGAVGTVATNNNPIGIAVSGRYAYITTESGSLQVIDVSNPAAMVVEGTLAGLGGQPRQLFASGRYAYVANEGGGTLQIIDVSNPNTPTLAGSIAAASCNSVHVVGRYAYATSYSGNVLRIIDVSNPSAPVQLSTVATGINPAFVYVNGRYAFVAAEGANQLECYDVSNPTSPTFVSGIGTGMTNPYCVNVSDKYAYVIDWIGGLFVVDVSNPAAMSVVGTLANPAFYLHASGHKVYTVDNGTTLRTIDVSNPSSPTSVGTSTAGNSAFAVYSAGRYVYVCNRSSNTVTAYDMGGAYVEAMESGNLEASRIQVRNDINVNGDIAAKGGIVAGTAEFHGGVGIATGGFKVASAGVNVIAGIDAATINASQYSAVTINSDNDNVNDVITINGGVEGQTLFIFFNHTAGTNSIVVAGQLVTVNNASHAGITMCYLGGAWRVVGSYLY